VSILALPMVRQRSCSVSSCCVRIIAVAFSNRRRSPSVNDHIATRETTGDGF